MSGTRADRDLLLNGMNIKKGDNVIVLAGKDKGKKGKIILSLPKKNKVVVEGLNMSKRHQRPRK